MACSVVIMIDGKALFSKNADKYFSVLVSAVMDGRATAVMDKPAKIVNGAVLVEVDHILAGYLVFLISQVLNESANTFSRLDDFHRHGVQPA